MSIVSIFRQAKANQKSSLNHLFQCNEITNQDPANNPNIAQKNIVITFDPKDNLLSAYFQRNGKNKQIIDRVEQRAEQLDKEARESYKKHKLAEKTTMENLGISKKIRTVLQSKKEQLKKEFIIAFGNTSRSQLMEHYKTPENLAKSAMQGAIAILEKKGLNKKNIIAMVLHMEEKGLPHIHLVYNDFSFSHNTTATQLAIKKHNGTKKEQYQSRIKEFSELQDTLATTMKLQRGEKGSRRKHLEIKEYKNKKDKEKNSSQQEPKKSIFSSKIYSKQIKGKEREREF